jgi:hypothetical protein
MVGVIGDQLALARALRTSHGLRVIMQPQRDRRPRKTPGQAMEDVNPIMHVDVFGQATRQIIRAAKRETRIAAAPPTIPGLDRTKHVGHARFRHIHAEHFGQASIAGMPHIVFDGERNGAKTANGKPFLARKNNSDTSAHASQSRAGVNHARRSLATHLAHRMLHFLPGRASYCQLAQTFDRKRVSDQL